MYRESAHWACGRLRGHLGFILSAVLRYPNLNAVGIYGVGFVVAVQKSSFWQGGNDFHNVRLPVAKIPLLCIRVILHYSDVIRYDFAFARSVEFATPLSV